MISASFIIVFKVGNIVNLLISLLSIFFSGIFFPTNIFSDYVENVSNLSPLKIGLDVCSQVLSPSFQLGSVNESLLQIFYMALILIPLGILLVYYGMNASKKNGSLNQY